MSPVFAVSINISVLAFFMTANETIHLKVHRFLVTQAQHSSLILDHHFFTVGVTPSNITSRK